MYFYVMKIYFSGEFDIFEILGSYLFLFCFFFMMIFLLNYHINIPAKLNSCSIAFIIRISIRTSIWLGHICLMISLTIIIYQQYLLVFFIFFLFMFQVRYNSDKAGRFI